jgi:hypothetical protein
MKNQDFKIVLAQFHLPIICVVFCFNTALTAGPPVPPTDSTPAGGLTSAASASKPTITLTNQSGLLISEAEVVRTNDGVSLVWEKDGGASGGVVRLEALPEDLGVRFGYDPAKTAAADELQKQRHAQWQQSVVAAQAAYLAQQRQMALNQNPTRTDVTNSFPAYTSPRYTPPHRHYIRYMRIYYPHRPPVSKPPVNKTGGGQKEKIRLSVLNSVPPRNPNSRRSTTRRCNPRACSGI